MYNTYQNFLQIASIGLSDNECVLEYQKDQSPICLATIFVRHYPALRQLSDLYWGLTDEDKASFCLEEVHKALLNYSLDRNTKFLTFMYSCVKNRMRTETEALDTDKRREIFHRQCFPAGKSVLINAADKTDDTWWLNKEAVKENSYMDADLLISIKSSELNKTEKAYCEYAIKNNIYATDSDFAKQQNISSAAVHYIKQSLRLKIGAVLA